MSKTLSRRDFLKGTAAGALGTAMAGILGACSSNAAETEAQTTAAETAAETTAAPATEVITETVERVTAELEASPVEAPDQTEYECDVLVIGGGFAGLNAAVAAEEEGQSVILIDKGRPGYSGLSPWPSSFRWIDEDLGDNPQNYRDCINHGGEFINNMDWYETWIKESKETYERLMDWGILTQYDRASDAGDYFDNEDYAGYREAFAQYDRRTKFIEVLNRYDIPYVENTMITNVIVEDGHVCGAVGFHVPSGAVITCNAKAVVMATGTGAYKPTGFPTGGDTFDGEYIAYNLGLPIIGKEFDDFHMTQSDAPGNVFLNNNWTYLENIWLCGGDITDDTVISYATSKSKVMVLDRVTKAMEGVSENDGSAIEDMSQQDVTRRGGSATGNPDDPRTGKNNDTMRKGDVYGVAVGMGAHLTNGVFCGLDDTDGFTGIDGLYVAGDGIHATEPTGAAYPCGVGFTSCFVSIDGKHAGTAAADYAAGADLTPISEERLEAEIAELQAPLDVESGFDPHWARDALENIMAPYWVTIAKSEPLLTATLAQIEYMRDNVIPKLMARDSHDLRLCLEMKHKVLSAEMKLRAGLARKETRGLHYRTDYPYRDDKNYLCYIAVQKDADGAMTTSRVDIKDEWKGDLSEDYTERYTYYFPGEAEAVGFEVQESSGWGG